MFVSQRYCQSVQASALPTVLRIDPAESVVFSYPIYQRDKRSCPPRPRQPSMEEQETGFSSVRTPEVADQHQVLESSFEPPMNLAHLSLDFSPSILGEEAFRRGEGSSWGSRKNDVQTRLAKRRVEDLLCREVMRSSTEQKFQPDSYFRLTTYLMWGRSEDCESKACSRLLHLCRAIPVVCH